MTRRTVLGVSRSLLVAMSLLIMTAGHEATAGPAPLAPPSERADRIVIEKSARRMTLWQGQTQISVHDVSLGFAPLGDKTREGDGKTPEGIYRVDRRNDRSAYHLSLGINYPTPDERAEATRDGRDPGGDIFIHGQPNRLPNSVTLPGDWTAGCIAVSNAEIQTIWTRVAIGTTVEIRP